MQEPTRRVPHPTRRSLLLGAACALLPGMQQAFAQAAAPGARKVISVAGRRARVVDIHAHCYIPGSARTIAAADVAAQANPAENAPVARLLTISDARITQMDARGIDVGILSVNQYWWYAANAADAEKFIRFQDDGLREIVNRYPGRFAFLSSPALQHPALAAQQLEHAVKNLGARGASIGGHVNGKVPSTPEFDVFWAKAQELDVPVFMHPGGSENIVKPGGLDGRGDLGNVIGNPLETTLFATRMIFDGTLDRFPKLKLILAHGGGYLASYLGARTSPVSTAPRRSARTSGGPRSTSATSSMWTRWCSRPKACVTWSPPAATNAWSTARTCRTTGPTPRTSSPTRTSCPSRSGWPSSAAT